MSHSLSTAAVTNWKYYIKRPSSETKHRKINLAATGRKADKEDKAFRDSGVFSRHNPHWMMIHRRRNGKASSLIFPFKDVVEWHSLNPSLLQWSEGTDDGGFKLLQSYWRGEGVCSTFLCDLQIYSFSRFIRSPRIFFTSRNFLLSSPSRVSLNLLVIRAACVESSNYVIDMRKQAFCRIAIRQQC